jgi:cell division protein YceG involved in septum cleavage
LAKPLIQYKRRSKRRSALRQLLNYFFAGVVLAVLALGLYLYWFSVTRLTPQEIIYVVEPGASLRSLTQKLHDQGVLPDAHSLVWLAYIKGQERHLKAGEYRFRKGR